MLILRPSRTNDINFVYSSWLKCYREDSPLTKYTRRRLFFEGHQKILDGLLASPQVQVIVACDGEEQDLIYGYLAYEPGVLHFIYVKEAFRKMGIAKQLMSKLDLENFKISHLTYTLLDLWSAGKIQCEYDPYALERKA